MNWRGNSDQISQLNGYSVCDTSVCCPDIKLFQSLEFIYYMSLHRHGRKLQLYLYGETYKQKAEV